MKIQVVKIEHPTFTVYKVHLIADDGQTLMSSKRWLYSDEEVKEIVEELQGLGLRRLFEPRADDPLLAIPVEYIEKGTVSEKKEPIDGR